MKKLFNSIKNKANAAYISAKTAIESTSGEGYIDTVEYACKCVEHVCNAKRKAVGENVTKHE